MLEGEAAEFPRGREDCFRAEAEQRKLRAGLLSSQAVLRRTGGRLVGGPDPGHPDAELQQALAWLAFS